MKFIVKWWILLMTIKKLPHIIWNMKQSILHANHITRKITNKKTNYHNPFKWTRTQSIDVHYTLLLTYDAYKSSNWLLGLHLDTEDGRGKLHYEALATNAENQYCKRRYFRVYKFSRISENMQFRADLFSRFWWYCLYVALLSYFHYIYFFADIW